MKKIIPVIVAVVLIIVIAAAGFGTKLLEKYSYSKERADLTEYFGITGSDDVPIILQDEQIEERARRWDGVCYFDLATVHKYFNDRFYEDQKENLLIYTLPDAVVSVSVGASSLKVGDSAEERDYVIARYEGDTLYVAADFVKEYANFSYELYGNPYHMQVYTEWNERLTATVTKDTQVRYQGGIKSDILTDVSEGDKVVVLEQMEKWSKVKTADAFIGYVENKRLSDITPETPAPVTDYAEPVYASNTRDHKINLAWHNVASASGNDTFNEMIAGAKSVNVDALCPRDHLVKRVVTRRGRYVVPRQIDLVVSCVGRIHRLRIICHGRRRLRRDIAQPLILHIADKGVRRLDLAPLLHLFEHDDLVPFGDVRQDIALDTALIAHLRVFGDSSRQAFVPLRIHLHMVRVPIQLIGKIRIFLHKIRRDIQSIPFISGDHIIPLLRTVAHFQGRSADRHADDGIRKCIYKKILFLIFIKSVVKIFVHRGEIKIAYAVPPSGAFLDLLILQDNRHIVAARDAEILCQISPFFGIGIFLQQFCPKSRSRYHNNKDDRDDHRNYLFHVSSSFPTVLIITDYFLSVITILTFFIKICQTAAAARKVRPSYEPAGSCAPCP